MKPQKIEISHKTIIFTVLFLASLAVLWNIRSLLIVLFFCFIFMEALNPAVTRLEKMKVPRLMAILTLYVVILGFIAFALAGIVPILIEQTTGLINALPNIIQNTKIFGASAIDLSSQFKIIETLPSGIARAVVSIFSNIFSAFVVFIITFYLLLERKNFGKYGQIIFGSIGKRKVLRIIEGLETRLGSWVNAEFFLMTIVGLLSYLGYSILGLSYAVPLALLAGFLEIVPNFGPIVATLVAALVGLTISPLTAVLTVVLGIVIQQVENNFIVPKIMKETIGLNPLVTILLIAAGAQIGDVTGAVLAIPIFLTIEVIFKILTEKEK